MVYAYKDLRVVYKICFSRAIFDIQAAILVFTVTTNPLCIFSWTDG